MHRTTAQLQSSSNQPEESRSAHLAHLREQAERWVNAYTATAIAAVLAVSWVPGAATAVLCGLEAILCFQIGKLYIGEDWTNADAAAAAKLIGLAALAGPLAAMEATILLGPLAFLAKPAVAAGIVKAMGQLVIGHFEGLAKKGAL